MKKLALHWKIVIGLLLGVVWALLSSYFGLSAFTIDWISPFGDIFIRLLKMLAVPLVLFSIISGVASLSDISKLGRLGAKTLFSYLITTVAAVSLGLLLVNIIKPGELVDEDLRIKNRINYEIWVENTPGIIKLDNENYLTNPKYSKYVPLTNEVHSVDENTKSKVALASVTKDAGPLQFIVDMVPDNIFKALWAKGAMLQVIFFAIFFGISLAFVKEKAKVVIGFVEGTNEVFLKMVDLLMKASPFFVFALLAGVVSKMAGDSPSKVIELFQGIGWYALVVFMGLISMAFIIYPLIIMLLSKNFKYVHFFKAISPAQILAFSSSSSAATLPVTMECLEENLKVSPNVTSFVLPIGATVNMDGTSLYQAVAVVFLAQFHMVELDFTQQLTIILTATLASIGSAAVPSAGLIMLAIVLQSVQLNPIWIAIIMPVDRILDMVRTVVNVTGDATVALLVAKSENEVNN